MGDYSASSRGGASRNSSGSAYFGLIVVAIAAIVFLGCIISPPSLMDDVDAVQAQISRNMLDSGDWVTARLDGVATSKNPP
jgi:4-amino-4-deoxy-L-arabinose transferase and related glycosyltransferases of PMT family